jgi:hypothetical protein
MIELQPDTGDVLQEEPFTMPVQGMVSVSGPVRVQELPRKGGSTRTRSVSDTRYQQVLENDARRGQVTLMSMDYEMQVGFTETSMQDAMSMTVWPKGVPLVLTACTEVWVICAEATKTTRVSVTTELWAQG